MSKIIQDKVKMRQALKELRSNIPKDIKHKADIEIISRFLMTPEYSGAQTVLCYAGTKEEIDTSALIYAALANKKRVGLPRCNGEILDFYYITSLQDLMPGSFGIMEPDPRKCKRILDFRNSILVVPGLGFSLDGKRIGYGRGYYDRFISHYQGKTIGLCYYPLVKVDIPMEETDKKVNLIITERYTRNI